MKHLEESFLMVFLKYHKLEPFGGLLVQSWYYEESINILEEFSKEDTGRIMFCHDTEPSKKHQHLLLCF